MTDGLLPDDDTSASSWSSEDDHRRFVIDFTVGPPGVGPVTSQANDDAREPRHPSDELEDHGSGEARAHVSMIRDRLSDRHVRAAGASSIIEGDVNPLGGI